MSFSKKFVSSFLRDSMAARPVSIVRLFESPASERIDVKVHHLPYETYTAINVNPYTLEEQLMLYPVVCLSGSQPLSRGQEVVAPLNNMPLSVVVHQPQRNHIIIDVE